MRQALPFLPGYTFRDRSKDRHVLPQTLVFSKGTRLSKPLSGGSAVECLKAQNRELDHNRLVELTYGPRREPRGEVSLPRYLALDKKVLRFQGYFREESDDCAAEGGYRIRPVKVLYYLQNDTMEVIEPRTPNSGLVQGTLFKRQVFPHPKGKGRRYLWKDLNLGQDVKVYGISIRLTDCDQWTREYLTDAGIEVNDSESMPPDPHALQRRGMQPRHEGRGAQDPAEKKMLQFMRCDRKVLRFYGTWQDVLSDPPEMRKVILQYYLADDTMELLEDHAPNCGRDPFKVLIRKQKIPVDRNELPETFPLSYLEIQDEDLRWFQPSDLRTGKDILVFGKKIFLYDCDGFTRHFYKTRLGVEDMESIAVAEKPKTQPPKVIPPHTGIGSWDDSLQSCLSIIPKAQKKDFQKELHFDNAVLRFKAEMVSPLEDDRLRRFVVSFYPSDDSVSIHEESVPNSGFPGGAFYKRDKIPKKRQSDPSVRPVYYQANDFYVGAQIRAAGKLFRLVDADPYVQTFMGEHPELYTEENVKAHKDGMSMLQNDRSDTKLTENIIAKKLRENVLKNYGTSPYPLPKILNSHNHLQDEEKVREELYSANLPIPQTLMNTVVDSCIDPNKKVNLEKLREILEPALGHNH